MMPANAVDADSRLDRRNAAHVLRRAAPMLRPYRRQMWIALGCVVLSTGAILAGPLLVRYGIDSGIAEERTDLLNWAVVAYVVPEHGPLVRFDVHGGTARGSTPTVTWEIISAP